MRCKSFGTPAKDLGCPADSLTQNSPQPFPICHLPYKGFHGLTISPGKVHTACVFQREDSPVPEVHGKSNGTACGNVVEAQPGAKIVKEYNFLKITQPALGTQTYHGFEFRSDTIGPLKSSIGKFKLRLAVNRTAMATP